MSGDACTNGEAQLKNIIRPLNCEMLGFFRKAGTAGGPNNGKPLLDMALSFPHGNVVCGECETVRNKREFQSESG
jgi:hypothetical protein